MVTTETAIKITADVVVIIIYSKEKHNQKYQIYSNKHSFDVFNLKNTKKNDFLKKIVSVLVFF